MKRFFIRPLLLCQWKETRGLWKHRSDLCHLSAESGRLRFESSERTPMFITRHQPCTLFTPVVHVPSPSLRSRWCGMHSLAHSAHCRSLDHPAHTKVWPMFSLLLQT